MEYNVWIMLPSVYKEWELWDGISPPIPIFLARPLPSFFLLPRPILRVSYLQLLKMVRETDFLVPGTYQPADLRSASSFLQVPGQTFSRGASVDGTASRDPSPSPYLPPSSLPGGSKDGLVDISSISLTDAEPDKESPPLGHLASAWMVIKLSSTH